MNLKQINVWAWWLLVGLEYFLIMTFTYHFSVSQGLEGLDLPRNLGGGKDSEFYFKNITTSFLTGTESNPTGTQFIPMMTAVANYFGFVNVFFMKSINIVGVFLLLFLMIKTLRSIGEINDFDTDMASMSTLVRFALFPSSAIVIGTTLNRDIWIYTFFMFSALFSVKLVKNKKGFLYLPLLILAIYGLYSFRGYAGLSVVAGSLLYFIIKYTNKYLFGVITFAGVILLFGWFQIFKDFEAPIVNMTLLDALGYQGGYFSSADGNKVYQRAGGTDFMEAFNVSNFIVFIGQFIKSYVGNLIGPFIWQVRTPMLLMLFILEYVPMLFLIWRVVFKFKFRFLQFLMKNNGALMIVCQGFAWFTMLALSNKNIGAGMRLKVPLFLFIWIVYYSYLAYEKKQEAEKSNF